MPGIFGVCDYAQKLDLTSVAEEMKNILSYNSFMKSGYRSDSKALMGKVNLGLGTEDDTVYSTGGLLLAWHGRIFNFEDNSHDFKAEGTAEKLGRLYRKSGPHFISKLKGSFAIAVWDVSSQTLVLGTDRFGTRPLYYFAKSDLFAFCSEIKGLLALPGFESRLNYAALAELFTFGFLLEEKTLLEKVTLIPPGHVLIARRGKIELKKYWKPYYQSVNPRFKRKEAGEECMVLLEKAVRKNLEEGLRTGLFLSGGLDSRLLAGLTRKNSAAIETFTFGTKLSLDAHLASRIANSLDLRNSFFELSPDFLIHWAERGVWYTEGMSNCLNFAGIEVLPQVRDRSPVVFNGYGGNEFFGFLSGNLAKFYYRGRPGQLADDFYPSLATLFSEKEKELLFVPELFSQIRGKAYLSLKEVLSRSEEKTAFTKLYNFMLTQKARRSNLLGIIMDHSYLEYALPFYDYDWADFALSLPQKERVWAKFYRFFLASKFPALSRIPYQRTGLLAGASLGSILVTKMLSKIGINMSDRTLSGLSASYLDYPGWTRGELKGFIQRNLRPENLSSRDYFNYGYIQRMLSGHFESKTDNSAKIGMLITFEIWHRQFMKRNFPG